MHYYLFINNEITGPYIDSDVVRMYAVGQISLDTLCHNGQGDWMPLKVVFPHLILEQPISSHVLPQSAKPSIAGTELSSTLTKKQKKEFRRAIATFFLFVLGLTLLSSLSIHTWFVDRRIASDGQKTVGYVAEYCPTTHSVSDCSILHNYRVTYGKNYTSTLDLGRSGLVGSRIQLIYDTENPNDARLITEDGRVIGFSSLPLSIVIMALDGFLVWTFFKYVYKPYRHKSLESSRAQF